jgi:ribose/xylose/arabinose/galactoside ABC-type transport system permease subunit
VVITDEGWLTLGTGTLLGVPYLVLLLVSAFAVFGWAMPRTSFGRYAYAIGSNARASRLAGVAVGRWRLAFYVTCGGLAAVAGLMYVARTGNAQPSAALGYELDVITAVILGGTSLAGGRGTLAGTLVALLVIGIINNGLTLVGVPSYWQQVVKGAILLAAVLYDELRRHGRDEA